jgi:hypothetical protein
MVPLSLLVRNMSLQDAGQNIEKAAYAIAGRLSSRLSKKTFATGTVEYRALKRPRLLRHRTKALWQHTARLRPLPVEAGRY